MASLAVFRQAIICELALLTRLAVADLDCLLERPHHQEIGGEWVLALPKLRKLRSTDTSFSEEQLIQTFACQQYVDRVEKSGIFLNFYVHRAPYLKAIIREAGFKPHFESDTKPFVIFYFVNHAGVTKPWSFQELNCLLYANCLSRLYESLAVRVKWLNDKNSNSQELSFEMLLHENPVMEEKQKDEMHWDEQNAVAQLIECLERKGCLKITDGKVVANLGKQIEIFSLVDRFGIPLRVTVDAALAFQQLKQFNQDFNHIVWVQTNDSHSHLRRVAALVQNCFEVERYFDCSYVPNNQSETTKQKGLVVDFLRESFENNVSLIKENGIKFEDLQQSGNVKTIAEQLAFTTLVCRLLITPNNDNDHLGTYVQYAHARLFSVCQTVSCLPSLADTDMSNLATSEVAWNLALQLSRFPDVQRTAVAKNDLRIVFRYLHNLAKASSAAHSVLRVKQMPPHIANARALLLDATRIVLASGLRLVGLIPLERM